MVITHHLPSPRSVAERYRLDHLSSAFASDLDKVIIQFGPALSMLFHTDMPLLWKEKLEDSNRHDQASEAYTTAA